MPVLHVLPQQAHILLVHADHVLHQHGLSLAVDQRAVKVVDVAQAVTAQRQRVGAVAQAIVLRMMTTGYAVIW
jgi:hypothetical protein